MDEKNWKIIQDFPDYQINNIGEIRRIIPDLYNRKLKKLKKNKDNTGYFKVRLSKDKKIMTKYIHILVYETFNNYKLKNNECVHHKDQNKENNYYKNLKLKLKSEHNSFHHKNKLLSEETRNKMSKNCSFKIGEKNNNSKLKENEVWLIKKILNSDYYKSGKITQKIIGRMFNVSYDTISCIKLEKRWRDIN